MLYHGDARALPLGTESVHCIVSSPPYGTGVEYAGYTDLVPWSRQYRQLVRLSSLEMHRVLIDGGRAWINLMPAVPRPGQSGRFDLAGMWKVYLTQAGFEWRDTVIWRQDSYDAACGWGSWRRPSAPNLRGGYEVVLSLYKPPYRRPPPPGHEQWHDPSPMSFSSDTPPWVYEPAWQDLCRNIWTIRPARRKHGAPAPFPHELPARCIRLSTYPDETVLDPFAGSGVTVEAAEALGRRGLGFDIGASEEALWQPS